MLRLKNFLLYNKSVHKWMVLFFDTVICTVSMLVASYLISLTGQAVGSAPQVFIVAIAVVAYGLFFLFFSTSDIAPNNRDFKSSLRSLDAVSGTFIALMLLNLILKMTGRPPFITNSVLILSTILSVFFVGGYRFIASLLTRNGSINNTAITTVAVCGSETHFANIKYALENESGHSYKIKALFVQRPTHEIMDGTKVYNYEKLMQVLKKESINLLLFSGNDINHEQKSEFVNFCFSNDVLIKKIPVFEDWINGQITIGQLKDISIEELLGRGDHNEHSKQVLQLIASKRILITGAAGSIGSELAKQIAALRHSKLILCDQHETGLYELEYELKLHFGDYGKPEIYIGDVRDEGSMEYIFRTYKPQIVFHAAAYKHVPMMEANPSEAVRNNVSGTKVVADLSIKYGVERFLFISTDKAINPTNVMGATKRIAEMYVHSIGTANRKAGLANIFNGKEKQANDGTKFITTRFGNVLGSNGSVIPRFKEQIAAGGPVTVTHPDIIRYFMTISEACALVLEAVTMGEGGEVFRFDMGEPVKIIDLAAKMIRLAGYKPDVDIKIKFCGLRPGEKLFEEMLQKEQELVTEYHKKILVSKMASFDYDAVNEAVINLLEAAAQNKDEDVVRSMKRIIPEYISNNSVYQSFDEKKYPSAISSQ